VARTFQSGTTRIETTGSCEMPSTRAGAGGAFSTLPAHSERRESRQCAALVKTTLSYMWLVCAHRTSTVLHAYAVCLTAPGAERGVQPEPGSREKGREREEPCALKPLLKTEKRPTLLTPPPPRAEIKTKRKAQPAAHSRTQPAGSCELVSASARRGGTIGHRIAGLSSHISQDTGHRTGRATGKETGEELERQERE
jgi:hypothetical protein